MIRGGPEGRNGKISALLETGFNAEKRAVGASLTDAFTARFVILLSALMNDSFVGVAKISRNMRGSRRISDPKRI